VKLALFFLLLAPPAFAQVDGHVSALVDVMPDVSEDPGSQSVAELRTRIFIERRQQVGERLRLNLAAYVDGLIASRDPLGSPGTTSDAILRPGDLYVEYVADRFDVRAGYSRLVWGRLDEFQPTDVVNPIDLARFLLEGRSEARLPVGLVRGRAFLPGSSTLEGVLVPWFRGATFDQLHESSSPFNLLAGIPLPPVDEPDAAWNHVQGGARFTSTSGRLDWGVSAYRGLGAFAPFERYTMLGADFETVRGPWGLRGEAAWFTDERFEGGIGLDRRAGDYRVAATVLATRQPFDGTDALIVGSADRSFARETRTVRVFGVYDPRDDTGFARVIGAISLRDNVWLEGSGGLFAGSAPDTIGRLTRRDFLYARLKVFF
jgi:hypothetical protein